MACEDVPFFDTSALQEILFNDIRDLSVHDGIFRCTLYAFRNIPPAIEPVAVPVLNIAMPVGAVGPCAGKALAKVGSQTLQNVLTYIRGIETTQIH